MKHLALRCFPLLASLLLPCLLAAQWAQLDTKAGADFNTLWVDAVDKNTVWASLDQAANGYGFNAVPKVVRTIDGGKSWTTYMVSADPHDFITSIFARSANELWLTVISFADSKGKILHTTNGGQTFTHVAPDAFAAPGNYPDVIQFFDNQRGIALGDPVDGEYQVFTTADGGATWVQVPGSALPDPSPGEFGLQSSRALAGNAILIGTNAHRVLRSADWGHTWAGIELPAQPANTDVIQGIAFADAKNGLLTINYNPNGQSGGQAKPYRTQDGGLTWTVIEDSNGDAFDEYSLLTYVPGTTATFLSGNYDGYAYTKDFGVTWTYFENGKYRVPGVDCLDPNTCFGSIWSDSKNTGSKVARWVGYQLAEPNPGPYLQMRAVPNPTAGPVTVTFSAPLPADGLVYALDNTNTFLLVQKPVSQGQNSVSFDMASAPPGMYWLKAVVGSQVLTEKFFKK